MYIIYKYIYIYIYNIDIMYNSDHKCNSFFCIRIECTEYPLIFYFAKELSLLISSISMLCNWIY